MLETSVYLIAAILLFPALGGGVWLFQSALRQKFNLGRSIKGVTVAKAIAGAAWLAGFFLIIGISIWLNLFPLFTLGVFIWEGIGLYGAYKWYQLQKILTIWKLDVK